jgi:hypothetical protein
LAVDAFIPTDGMDRAFIAAAFVIGAAWAGSARVPAAVVSAAAVAASVAADSGMAVAAAAASTAVADMVVDMVAEVTADAVDRRLRIVAKGRCGAPSLAADPQVFNSREITGWWVSS